MRFKFTLLAYLITYFTCSAQIRHDFKTNYWTLLGSPPSLFYEIGFSDAWGFEAGVGWTKGRQYIPLWDRPQIFVAPESYPSIDIGMIASIKYYLLKNHDKFGLFIGPYIERETVFKSHPQFAKSLDFLGYENTANPILNYGMVVGLKPIAWRRLIFEINLFFGIEKRLGLSAIDLDGTIRIGWRLWSKSKATTPPASPP